MVQLDEETWEARVMKSHRSLKKGRSKSVERVSSKTPTTAGDAIRAAGYPLQIHTVTTPDGYIMQMERIPRPGAASAASVGEVMQRAQNK